MKNQLFVVIPLIIFSSACNKNNQENCPPAENILTQFVQPTGEEVIIDVDGNGYVIGNDGCELVVEYFDPAFRTDHYLEENGKIFIKSPDGNVEAIKRIDENFESYDSFLDIFYSNIEEVGLKIWGSMTLQSPAAKTVEEYVALRKCIQNGTCDFIDNKIQLAKDPVNETNNCLKFTSVEKTEDMVVCKSSIQSELLFFEKTNDLWFSADFFIEEGLPFSLVDFENSYFEQNPGPRVVISQNKLAIENKFGIKEFYRHDKEVFVPMEKWFNVKVHLTLDDTDEGLLELWQDEELLFSINGENLPLFNSIQNSLEVGISANLEKTIMYVDNLRMADQPL